MSQESRFDSPFDDSGRPKGFLARVFSGAELPAFYFRRYKKLMVYGLISLVLVDLLELLPPLILKWAVDGIMARGPYQDLLLFSAAYLGVYLLQGVFRYGWRVYLIRSSHLAGRDLRGSFVHHLFGLPASFFEKNRVGDLMAHANSDVDAVRQFTGPGILVIADALFYMATVPLVMLWLDWKLALISFLTLPIIPFIAYRLEELIHHRYKASQDQFSVLSAMAQENLNGVRVVKAFAMEDIQSRKFAALGEKYIELNLKLAKADKTFGPIMDFFTSLGIVFLLWFGGSFVISDAVTLGTFVAFHRYIQKMVWPMIAVGFGASLYQRSNASTKRLKGVFDQTTHVPEPVVAKAPERSEGRIEIRGLSFTYPGAAHPSLHDIDLTIESGMRVAFVGEIGSGKSTLLSLLPRLYPVARGMLVVDGVDVNDWSVDELRKQIGMVTQEVFLFSETVMENIAFGLEEPHSEFKSERVRRAVETAHISHEIETLPQGAQTQLGERGVNLSGGQKQRISLARALAREPKILILDDSLSAVDVRTEEKILTGLRGREGKNTELIAAHRISTVRDADLIVVMKKGSIIQRGRHEDLIRDEGNVYHQFYEQQRLREELENYLEEIPSGVQGP